MGNHYGPIHLLMRHHPQGVLQRRLRRSQTGSGQAGRLGARAVAGRDLTLGGEMNKLASNIMLGRDAVGVHYPSDGVEGLRAGEQQAIGVPCEYSRTCNERFDGFDLTRFGGRNVEIANGKAIAA
jgi:hypothetical protein